LKRAFTVNTMIQDSPTDLLAACEREPIRTPGSIQPHGFLLTLSGLDIDSADNALILQVSDNLAQHTGIDPHRAIGRRLRDVIGAGPADQLRDLLDRDNLGERPTHLAVIAFHDIHYDVLAHLHDRLLVLEFEPARQNTRTRQNLAPVVGGFLSRIDDVETIDALGNLAVDEISALTGFGRVLFYRFDEDGHGDVLAERVLPELAGFLGQRFPASDIPAQARALYLLNRVRLIQDASYTPAQLLPRENPRTGRLNDLSYANLRSVSPVHLQYMRNMGTLASMSISLIVKGKLWGLISCHNATPCPVTFHQRTVCEQLGQILALRIGALESADELQFRLDVRRVMVDMLAGLTQGADFIENLRSVLPDLLQFARASGVAIVVDDRLISHGDTPDEKQVRALVDWLNEQDTSNLFHTDRLSDHYEPALAFTRNASGLLAMPISRIHKHYLLWFRPELVHVIDWAGRPDGKQVVGQRLTPRASFDIWRETVHGASLQWREGELDLAREFRTALLGIALERAEEMAGLAEELGRANKELEAFSYSVSHDLRAPLRHIVGYSNLLLEAGGSDDPERRSRFLVNIKDSARLAGKLVDDLLSFSQMGRAALRPVRIDMNKMVASCIDRLRLDIGERVIDWRIDPLPAIMADPNFLHLAVYNLLSNAVKFTASRERASIHVGAETQDAATVFHIADNGVGFNMDYVHKLFGVFQRLHRMEEFHGTGIGLANVRRIVERHGGSAWACSATGEGATFSFSIPNNIEPSEEAAC
jgi:chemotaxis family two-component system sensor kinase Cph1